MIYWLLPLTIPVWVYTFWMMYIGAININNAYKKDRLPKFTKVLCYPLVGGFLAADFLTNAILLSLLFLELPKEKTVTARLNKHAPMKTWRGAQARWWGKYWVNPFDLIDTHVRW